MKSNSSKGIHTTSAQAVAPSSLRDAIFYIFLVHLILNCLHFIRKLRAKKRTRTVSFGNKQGEPQTPAP